MASGTRQINFSSDELREWRPDWHQLASVYVLSPDQSWLSRFKWMTGSILMMCMLTFVTVGVLQGIDEGSCMTSSDCFTGHWCSPLLGHCEPCLAREFKECRHLDFLAAPPDSPKSRQRNATRFLRKRAFQLTQIQRSPSPGAPRAQNEHELMCESCYSERVGGFVDAYTIEQNHVRTMRISDWATAMVAILVVSLSACKELRDVQLLELTWQSKGSAVGPGWQCALCVLSGLRQFSFLPALVMTVPHFIHVSGGTALQICLDTVAVLFVLELDILLVRVALDDQKLPALSQQMRSAIDIWNADGFAWFEYVHLVFLPVALLFVMTVCLWVDKLWSWFISILCVPLTFLVAALLSALVVRPKDLKGSVGNDLLYVLMKFLIGTSALIAALELGHRGNGDMQLWAHTFSKASTWRHLTGS